MGKLGLFGISQWGSKGPLRFSSWGFIETQIKSDMAHWVASGLRFGSMGVIQRKIWVIRAPMDSDLAYQCLYGP